MKKTQKKPLAAQVAEDYVGHLRQNENLMSRWPFARTMMKVYIHQALYNTAWQGEMPKPPNDSSAAREMMFAAMDAGTRTLWEQYRVAYDIDPTLWAELGDAEPTTVIPDGLFTKLPHPNPFVCFPEPLVLPLPGQNQNMVVRGFFVVGSIDRVQASTQDSNGALNLLIGADVLHPDGRPVMLDDNTPDSIWNRCTIDTGGRDMTLAELTEQILSRFNAYRPAGDIRNDLPKILARAVNCLVYLCAENAELRPLPAPKGSPRPRRGRNTPPPTNVVQVGYTVGAELRAYYQREANGIMPGDGRTMPPHIRRSHPHTFRRGPGRRERFVKWLGPMLINFNKPEKTTVIPVNKRR